MDYFISNCSACKTHWYGSAEKHRPATTQDCSGSLRAFSAVIAYNGAKAAALLTKPPFLIDGKSPRDHAGFEKICPGLFDAKARAGFATAKAIMEADRFEVYCGRSILYFGVVYSRYLLTEFAADPQSAL